MWFIESTYPDLPRIHSGHGHAYGVNLGKGNYLVSTCGDGRIKFRRNLTKISLQW